MITRRNAAISLVAALGSLAAGAQQRKESSHAGGPAERPPSFEDVTRRPVVYTVPGMDKVRVREGLVYKSAAGSSLLFDLYAPASVSGPRPAVILVHGGPVPALGARRWGIFTSYGRILAASGIVGIAFDHRLLGPDRLPDSASDLADLVQHVRAQAGPLGINANSLALWAFSGGGPLIAAALRERSSWWKLIVGYYTMLEPLDGAKDERFSAIAALGRDASNAPPIVLARAGLDNPALNATIDRFVAAANSAGATVDLFTHPTGHHAFDVLDAGPRSSQIIERTMTALRRSLG